MKSGPHYDFGYYRQLVHEITQAFNGISKELIQMKDRFREVYDRPDLSEHLEKIQELEKEKLSLVCLNYIGCVFLVYKLYCSEFVCLYVQC